MCARVQAFQRACEGALVVSGLGCRCFLTLESQSYILRFRDTAFSVPHTLGESSETVETFSQEKMYRHMHIYHHMFAYNLKNCVSWTKNLPITQDFSKMVFLFRVKAEELLE